MGEATGDGRWRWVGVQVLQAQEAGIAGALSDIAHLVHADSRNVQQP
jgi:hypothetical protein